MIFELFKNNNFQENSQNMFWIYVSQTFSKCNEHQNKQYS